MAQSDRVLEAALEIFDEVGYSAATIEDIRTRSGVSTGSIYHHFDNKEGIAGALYVQALQSFQSGLTEVLAGEGVAEDGIRAGVRHYLRWVDSNRAQARFLMRRRETEVVAASRADVDALNRDAFRVIEHWYRPLATAGRLRDLPLPLLHAIWFGPAHEYARLVLEGMDKVDLLEAETPLANAAWAALRSSR